MDHLHWRHLLAKPLATATHDSHMTTWLGHLGRSDRDRIISILVTSPKAAKCVAVMYCCLRRYQVMFANVNTALEMQLQFGGALRLCDMMT
jgi:hypothetical protein